jgi:hypothetical protein
MDAVNSRAMGTLGARPPGRQNWVRFDILFCRLIFESGVFDAGAVDGQPHSNDSMGANHFSL